MTVDVVRRVEIAEGEVERVSTGLSEIIGKVKTKAHSGSPVFTVDEIETLEQAWILLRGLL